MQSILDSIHAGGDFASFANGIQRIRVLPQVAATLVGKSVEYLSVNLKKQYLG